VSNAPSKPVSFSRPKVGYFSNRPRILILLYVIADVSLKESDLQCLMLWLIYIFCCILSFKLLIVVWELKISDCYVA